MRRLRLIGLMVGAASALSVVGASLAPGTALAAGSGYTPGGTGPGGSATGLPGTVISTSTIQPSGGSGSGTIGGSSITVNVPPGTFPNPVQLVLTDASSSTITPSGGGSVVVVFGVGFYENGTKVTGTFPPVTVTVTSSSITAGSTVYLIVGGQLVAASGASVTNGSATFTITSDPTVEIVAAPAATTSISGATAAVTGEPFRFEEIAAASLVALGGLGLLLVRRRHRAA